MLVSCKYCSKYHDRKETCSNKPKRIKESNEITRFRSSRIWKRKSLEIRKRDNYLCMACLNGIETIDSKPRYTFKDLQVHHIVSIANNYTKRLDNNNLITLCTEHHSMADRREISASILMDIVKDIETRQQTTTI